MCMRHYGDSFASKLAPTPDSGFVREQARSHTGFGIRSRASSLPHRIRDSFASKLAPTPSKLAPTPDSFASKLAPTPDSGLVPDQARSHTGFVREQARSHT